LSPKKRLAAMRRATCSPHAPPRDVTELSSRPATVAASTLAAPHSTSASLSSTITPAR
jgi:hypothetical protein